MSERGERDRGRTKGSGGERDREREREREGSVSKGEGGVLLKRRKGQTGGELGWSRQGVRGSQP